MCLLLPTPTQKAMTRPSLFCFRNRFCSLSTSNGHTKEVLGSCSVSCKKMRALSFPFHQNPKGKRSFQIWNCNFKFIHIFQTRLLMLEVQPYFALCGLSLMYSKSYLRRIGRPATRVAGRSLVSVRLAIQHENANDYLARVPSSQSPQKRCGRMSLLFVGCTTTRPFCGVLVRILRRRLVILTGCSCLPPFRCHLLNSPTLVVKRTLS
jgi:hypothetical protein